MQYTGKLPNGVYYSVTVPEGTSPQRAKAEAWRQYRKQRGNELVYGVAQNLAGGLMAGADDEAAGLVAGVVGRREGEGFSEAYTRQRDATRETKANLGLAGTGLQAIGGAMSGGPVVGALKQVAPQVIRAFTPAARAVLGGSAAGAVSAAGDAPEMEDIPSAMGYGGTVGAGASLAMAPAGRMITGAGRLLGATWRKITEGSDARATRLFREIVEDSGQSIDEFGKRMDEIGPDAVAADLNDATRAKLRALTAKDSNLRPQVYEQLDERARMGGTRLVSDAAATMNAPVSRLNDSINDMIELRSQNAKANYEPIYGEAIQPTEELTKILNRPAARKGYKNAKEMLANEGKEMPEWIAPDGTVTGIPTLREIDSVKRGMDGVIDDHTNEFGKTDGIGRSAVIAKNHLLKYIDDNYGDLGKAYGKARDAYAGESALITASKRGGAVFKEDADDVRRYMSRMSESERDAYRHGAFNAARDEVESANITGTAAIRQKFNSRKYRRRLRAAFDSDEQFDEFVGALDREKTYQETRNMVEGGSPTARIQQDVAGLEEQTGEIPIDAGIGEVAMRAIRSAMDAGAPKVSFTDEVNQGLVQSLMGKQAPIPRGPVQDIIARAAGAVPYSSFGAGAGAVSPFIVSPEVQGLIPEPYRTPWR